MPSERSDNIQAKSRAGNRCPVFPVGNGSHLVAVELAKFAYLGHKIGAFLVLPLMLAVPRLGFRNLGRIEPDFHCLDFFLTFVGLFSHYKRCIEPEDQLSEFALIITTPWRGTWAV